VSWGILLPVGAIFARYLKTFHSADPAWFYLHVTASATRWASPAGPRASTSATSRRVTYTLHRSIGTAAFALATVQVLALLIRPNKGHRYRLYWNAYHHSVGYAVIVLGIVNVFKGMAILGVEQRWRTAYVAAVFVLSAVAVTLEAVTWGVVVRRRKAEGKTFSSASSGHMPHSV
jgi:hypothetical protein